MVVAQFVERPLLTPEVNGSNPIIDNFNLLHLEDEYSDKGDQKEAGNGHF